MNPEQTMEELFDELLGDTQPRAEVEVVSAQPSEPEEPKNYWEEKGFLPEIARICVDLEGEREQFLFNSTTRQIIATINNAQRVEDFDRYTDNQLAEFADTLRRRIPEIERQVSGFIGQLNRARTVQVDTVDFI